MQKDIITSTDCCLFSCLYALWQTAKHEAMRTDNVLKLQGSKTNPSDSERYGNPARIRGMRLSGWFD